MRRRPRRAPRGDDDSDEEEEEEEEPSGPPRARRGGGGRASIQPWRPTDGDARDDEDEPGGWMGFLHRPRRPVYFRARDSAYFEFVVAAAILALMLVSLWAYTQNWPPVYVIESNSMQHGSSDNLGLINTGDLVLAQRIPTDQITPYVAGIHTGYTTYGEYGDVLLYHADGISSTPVIHRAIIFLVADHGAYDAPSLAGLPCGAAPNAVYAVSSTPSGCGTTGLSGTLTLHDIGWQSVDVTIALGTLGGASGFITMGDNNYLAGTSPATGLTDQSSGISALVQPGWVVGVARGMLPWFGSVKLLLSGTASEVPTQSWEFLGLTLVAVVLVAMGVHYLLRAEGVEDPRRRAEEEDEADEEEDEGSGTDAPSGPSRWLHPIRAWRSSEEESEDEEPPRRSHPPSRRGSLWGGRPHPSVGRKAPRKRRGRSDESDDEL